MITNENSNVAAEKSSSFGVTVIRWVIFGLILLVIATFGLRAISKAYYTRHIVIHVTDKSIRGNGSSGKYMVYGRTIDGLTKVYEVTDSMLARRYDSDERYASIEVGKTYEFIVGGNRIGFLGWYPNIYNIYDVMVPDEDVWNAPRLKPLDNETEK
jgi:hypothetical protein